MERTRKRVKQVKKQNKILSSILVFDVKLRGEVNRWAGTAGLGWGSLPGRGMSPGLEVERKPRRSPEQCALLREREEACRTPWGSTAGHRP